MYHTIFFHRVVFNSLVISPYKNRFGRIVHKKKYTQERIRMKIKLLNFEFQKIRPYIRVSNTYE